jgi:hypothetical protein
MREIDYLLGQLREEVDAIQQTVGNGAAKDYADYQYLCGKIRGLLVAEEILMALKERMEQDDE